MAENSTELFTGELGNAHEPMGVIAEAEHADCEANDRSVSMLLVVKVSLLPSARIGNAERKLRLRSEGRHYVRRPIQVRCSALQTSKQYARTYFRLE